MFLVRENKFVMKSKDPDNVLIHKRPDTFDRAHETYEEHKIDFILGATQSISVPTTRRSRKMLFTSSNQIMGQVWEQNVL